MTKTLTKLKGVDGQKREKGANALEFTRGDKPLNVDRENGIIRHVKILGKDSRNDRTYPDPVRSKARPLYERRSVNISHPSRDKVTDDRPFESFFGRLENVTEEADGLYGDLHYIKSHPQAGVVCEAAERMPENFGLSHNAHVDWLVKDDGHRVCESINSVRSVDLVCRPATTNGIFESEDQVDDTANVTPAGGNGAPEPTADEPASVKCMLLDGVEQIFDGEGTPEEKAARIGQLAKTLLKVESDIDAAVNGTPADDDEDDEADDTASVKEKAAKAAGKQAADLADTKAQLAALQRREKARDALEAAGVEATGARIKGVAALESEVDQKALIEEFKKVLGQPAPQNKPKPKSVAANTLESQQGGKDRLPNGLKPQSRDQLAAGVKTTGSW